MLNLSRPHSLPEKMRRASSLHHLDEPSTLMNIKKSQANLTFAEDQQIDEFLQVKLFGVDRVKTKRDGISGLFAAVSNHHP